MEVVAGVDEEEVDSGVDVGEGVALEEAGVEEEEEAGEASTNHFKQE